MLILFVLLFVRTSVAQKYETVRFRIDESAVEYINTELRALIPSIQKELKNFPLPSVSGSGFGLQNLRLQDSRLGSTSINFQDNGLRLTTKNNNFLFTGNFWVRKLIQIRGSARVHIRNMWLDTTLGFTYPNQRMQVQMNGCRVNMGSMNIDLHNPLLNFIVQIMSSAIKNAATSIFCDAFRNQGVSAINKALSSLPSEYKIENIARIFFKPGPTSVNSRRLLTHAFAVAQPTAGTVRWNFREKPLPSIGATKQCCFWVSEYVVNSVIGTFLPKGKLNKKLDAAKSMGLAAPLDVTMINSGPPNVTLERDFVYFNSPMKLIFNGGTVDLGEYSTDIHLHSSTDITMKMLKRGLSDLGYEPPQHLNDYEFLDENVNPVEYMLNYVLPSGEYIRFFDATSSMSSGASKTCGKFRPTEKLKKMVHDYTINFLRESKRSRAVYDVDEKGGVSGVSYFPESTH